MKDAASALDEMMTKLTNGVKSNGFKEWLQAIEPLVKPTIEAIGTAIGHIATGLGGLHRGVQTVRGDGPRRHRLLHETVLRLGKVLGDGKHTGFNALIDSFQQNWPLVKQGLGDFAAILKNVLGDVTGLATGGNSKGLWEIANPLLLLLKAVSGNQDLMRVMLYLLAVNSAVGKLSATYKGIIGVTQLWTKAQAALDVAMDANPIGLIVLAVPLSGSHSRVAWTKSAGLGLHQGPRRAGSGQALPVVQGFKFITDAVLGFFGSVIHGAATAWVGAGSGPENKSRRQGFRHV